MRLLEGKFVQFSRFSDFFTFLSFHPFFFSTNREKKSNLTHILHTFHVDIFCPRQRHQSRLGFIIVRFKTWCYSLTMGQIFDRQFAEPTDSNRNQGKYFSFFRHQSPLLSLSSSHTNFWYLTITTWISFTNSKESECNWSLSCCLCLANIGERWNSLAKVELINFTSRLYWHLFLYFVSLCKSNWTYASIYNRARSEGISFRTIYLQLDEGTLRFNAGQVRSNDHSSFFIHFMCFA